jgi:hypothetical protein
MEKRAKSQPPRPQSDSDDGDSDVKNPGGRSIRKQPPKTTRYSGFVNSQTIDEEEDDEGEEEIDNVPADKEVKHSQVKHSAKERGSAEVTRQPSSSNSKYDQWLRTKSLDEIKALFQSVWNAEATTDLNNDRWVRDSPSNDQPPRRQRALNGKAATLVSDDPQRDPKTQEWFLRVEGRPKKIITMDRFSSYLAEQYHSGKALYWLADNLQAQVLGMRQPDIRRFIKMLRAAQAKEKAEHHEGEESQTSEAGLHEVQDDHAEPNPLTQSDVAQGDTVVAHGEPVPPTVTAASHEDTAREASKPSGQGRAHKEINKMIAASHRQLEQSFASDMSHLTTSFYNRVKRSCAELTADINTAVNTIEKNQEKEKRNIEDVEIYWAKKVKKLQDENNTVVQQLRTLKDTKPEDSSKLKDKIKQLQEWTVELEARNVALTEEQDQAREALALHQASQQDGAADEQATLEEIIAQGRKERAGASAE